jgi:hypothetical protein
VKYDDYVREGLSALENVFAKPEPDDPVLGPAAESAALIYACAGPGLDEAQWRVVARAAATEGDEAVWVSSLERATRYTDSLGFGTLDQELLSVTENWRLPLDGFDQYAATRFRNGSLSHALHSPNGRWAMLVHYDSYAVVAGRHRLVETILDDFPVHDSGWLGESSENARASVGTWLRDRREFRKRLRVEPEPNPWELRLVRTIYGAERARELLVANGWADFAPPDA